MFQPIRSALLIKKPLPHEVTYEVSQEIHHEPDQAALAEHEVTYAVSPTNHLFDNTVRAEQMRLNADEGAF